MKLACAGVLVALVAPLATAQPPTPLPGLVYDEPFFPGANHNPAIPAPDSILGFRVGERPATHAQIEAVCKALAESSPRVRLFEYARSHENRALYYLAISSEQTIRELDRVKADAARLADPRAVTAAEGDRLADTLPAVAWMAYAIHGDEMSGADAALAAAYHLAACTDDDVTSLLASLVVIIDPLMNPDGRDRTVRAIAENRTAQPNVDDQSLIHSGHWPGGRTNHYLFDLNRDWIFGAHPETRGRIAAAAAWRPHYFMESHEMGSLDTFLFMPPREPMNPNIPANVHKWLPRFADDLGAAFDARGWRYYTGEWNEEWYPGYSGAWGGLRGAIENLYEQASIQTDAVRRPEGTLESYRESVHKQLVSTMANLTTLAANRREVLRDFLAVRRGAVAPEGPYARRTFAVVPGANITRTRAFTDLMTLQGFEVHAASREFRASGRDRLGREVQDRAFPAGTILVANRQPEASLIAAMLEFDPRMTPEFLNEERRELLRFGRSRLYDVTAWNITMLYDLDSYELATGLPDGAAPYTPPAPAAGATNTDAPVAFVIDGADDRSVAAAGRLMERDLRVRVADKPFRFDGREFARGSVVVTRKDNTAFTGHLVKAVDEVAAAAGVAAIGVASGMGPGDLPDLGGEHFVLLETPRIAVFGREPFSAYGFGEAWRQIDLVLGLRASYLNANTAGFDDLRRYNVIVLPAGGARALKNHTDTLKTWVESGGTLIAIGSTAAALASETGIGAARLLPDVITKLDDHRQAIVREWEGRSATVDPGAVWSYSPPTSVTYPWLIGEAGDKPGEDEARRRDAWRALFSPQGSIVAGRVDDRSWLTAGCADYLPVMYNTDYVFIATGSVRAPIRLGAILPGAPEPRPETEKESTDEMPAPGWTLAPPGHELRLRMSGLLWPEAADRIAHSAYVTREPVGSGQVILFATSPTFRAASLGTARVFSNAVVYGPGMGASHPVKP